MTIETINTEKFKKEIFDYSTQQDFEFKKDKPLILNFYATWCGPCHAFRPALENAAEIHAGKFDIFRVDIDADPELPALFGIRGVPSTVFFIPNQEPALVTGNIGEEGLERALSELLGIK